MRVLLAILMTVSTVFVYAQHRDPLDRRDRRQAERERERRDELRREREARERRDQLRRRHTREELRRLRRDRWNDRIYRERMRRQLDFALIGEAPNVEIIGYTFLSDDIYDYELVEVLRSRNNRGMGYDDVKIKVLGDAARIDNLSIRFCNGTIFDKMSQNIIIGGAPIPERGSTPWYNLSGKNRCISTFAVSGVGDRRDDDETVVVLLGRNRIGN